MSETKGVSLDGKVTGWQLADKYNFDEQTDDRYVGAMYVPNDGNVLHIPSLRATACPDETDEMIESIDGHVIVYASAENDMNNVVKEYFEKMRSLRARDTASMDLLKRRVIDALDRYDKAMREYYQYVLIHPDNRFLDSKTPVLSYLNYHGYLDAGLSEEEIAEEEKEPVSDMSDSLSEDSNDNSDVSADEEFVDVKNEKEYIPSPIAEVEQNIIVPEYEEYELEDDDAPLSIPGLDAIMFTRDGQHYFKYRPYTETYNLAKTVYQHAQQVYDGELENERAAMSEVELQEYMEKAEVAFDKATERYKKAKAAYEAYVEETGNDFMRAQKPVDAYMDYMTLEDEGDVDLSVPTAEFAVDDGDTSVSFVDRLKELEALKAKRQVRQKHFFDILSSEYLSTYDSNAGQRRNRVVAQGYGSDDLSSLRESLGLSGDTEFQTFNGPDVMLKSEKSPASNKLMTDEQKAAALDAVSDNFNADSPLES